MKKRRVEGLPKCKILNINLRRVDIVICKHFVLPARNNLTPNVLSYFDLRDLVSEKQLVMC